MSLIRSELFKTFGIIMWEYYPLFPSLLCFLKNRAFSYAFEFCLSTSGEVTEILSILKKDKVKFGALILPPTCQSKPQNRHKFEQI